MAEGTRREETAGQPRASCEGQPPGRRGAPDLSRPQERHNHIRAISRAEVSKASVNRWVDRFGRTGFAAITSLIWFLPMAAWAGSADLSPIDKTAYPWVALSIGIVMFAIWLVILTRLARIPVTPRQRRLDIAQMSASEKRWTLALVAFGAGLIAWLNAAATVDWAPITQE